MRKPENSQSDVEVLLQRFALKEPPAQQREQVLTTAQRAWQAIPVQTSLDLRPFAKALAACVAVVLAVDIYGRLALSPWRPHLPPPQDWHTATVTEDLQGLVPSSRLLGGMTHGRPEARRGGLQDYRNHLNRLLHEPQALQPTKAKRADQRQGRYVSPGPAAWCT